MKQIILLKRCLYSKGGIEKNVWKIAKRFSERGFFVHIFTSSKQIISHPVFRLHFYKERKILPSFYKIHQFNRFCKKKLKTIEADIIFDMDRTENQTHIRAGNGVHKAYLFRRAQTEGFLKKISFILNPLHRILLSYEKTSFENVHLKTLFVNSNLVKKEILHFYKVNPQKIHVIYNGVQWKEMENSFLQSLNKKEDLLKVHQLPLNGFYFLFIGNGYARKGLLELLHAFSKIKQKNIHLLVAGKDKNISFYQKKAKQLKVKERVHFFGPLKDPIFLYQIADVFVLPSHYDPFSNVVLEALSMGLFVITTKDNGAHEILTRENGSTISHPTQIDEMYQALSSSLIRKKTKCSSLKIRDSVKNRDYSYHLDELIDRALL